MHTIWIWVILFRWVFFLVPSFPCKFKGVNIIIIIIIIFTSEQYSIVEMDRMFFIQSLVEGHLGFFQVLVIANNGTMKMVEQMPLCSDWAYFQYMTKIGIGEFWGMLFPNFLRHHHTNINGAVISLYSHQNTKVFQLPYILYSIRCHQCFWSWQFLQVWDGISEFFGFHFSHD